VNNVDDPTSVISWSTDTFATDPNANALRFATMFNFWFDADSPSPTSHALTFFKPGSPAAVAFWYESEIFVDGFELGDTLAWSQTVP
jgi:hypothetical protein